VPHPSVTSPPPTPNPWLTPRALTALLFPIAIWAFCTLFFRADLGRWNDDYFFNTLDPATGDIKSWALTTRDPYVDPTGHLGPWRPLLFTVITGLITLTWNHFWIAHLVGALLHAANTLVLFVILRKFGRSIHASAAACVLFLCWAVHNEAYLWASAFGSVTSALLFQFIVLCMVYFAKGGGWGWVFPIVFLTALILGFNEQASGALAALPLAYWAVCPDAQTTRERMKRAIIPTIAACTLIPIYVYLVRRYSPPGLGVEAESYVTLREFPDRMVAVAKDMLRNITLREFWYPAFALGWREWTAKNWLFLSWLIVLLATAIAALRSWIKIPAHGENAAQRIAARHAYVCLFSAAAAVGACAPIAIIAGYPAHSRVVYIVILVSMPALACCFDGLARLMAYAQAAPNIARILRTAVGLALCALMLFGGVMNIGAQARLRRTVQKDELNGRQLVEQVPDPLPDTVFLPLSIRPNVFTIEEIAFLHPWLKSDRFPRELDLHRGEVNNFHYRVRPVWEGLWSMRSFVKFQYQRNDLHCLRAGAGHQLILDATASHVRYIWPYGIPYPSTDPNPPADDPARINALIPWTHIIPITFDSAGNLQVVTRVIVERANATTPPLFIDIPQLADRVASHRVPPREVRIMLH